MKFLKEWIGETINEDINYSDYKEFSHLEEIDKRTYKSLKKANWENRKITVALKNLNPKITEGDFKEFIAKV